MRRALIAASLAVVAAALTAPGSAAGRQLVLRSEEAPLLRRVAFNAERTYRDLARQCAFGPRLPGTQAHADCARWLANTLYQSADEVRLQPFVASDASAPKPISDASAPKPLRLTNIIATFNPKGQHHVLLCAHWDSRPAAERDPDPASRAKPVPGANDGASGVAVLLEIARALKAAPPSQRVTIVLFDGEDYGLTEDCMFLGSRAFADAFTGPAVSWAALLDMVGDRELRLPVERVSQQAAPAVVERIWRAAEHVGAAAFVREPGPAVLDDHVFLLRKGIPCIDLIDFDYPYWHTTADTPDKCAPDSLAQVGRTLLAALEETP